jgi:hypothetical protein
VPLYRLQSGSKALAGFSSDFCAELVWKSYPGWKNPRSTGNVKDFEER